MNISHKILLALTTACLAVSFLSAQTTANSPYSRFGYGILGDNASGAQRMMGGVGYAMNSGRQINVMNPASYAYMDSLTFLFDMGLDLVRVNRTEDNTKNKEWGGGLEYITMQFPIVKGLAGSIGILPYSSVGYTFGSEIDNGTESHTGSGGLNQIYLGLGYTPFEGFAIGANVSYLFGNTYNDIYVYTEAGSTSLFEQSFEVRDYHLQFGAQYSQRIGRNHRMTLGVMFSPGKDLLGHAQVMKYDVSQSDTPDTLSRVSLRHNFSLPSTWGVGLNYQWQERLMVEADFTYQPWSKVKFAEMPDFSVTRFNNRYKGAVGLQYTPRERGKWVQRINYRAGAFYGRDYMKVGDNSVREWGLSCGFGMPNPNNKTIISLGFEYRHRQAHPNPLLKENYFSITLGVNFNEMWFFKNKIN
ncbi:MAG: hypothetical protein LIO90_09180 [Bacteroidales bacterium]|nr:hypothetical protein [Bacteroidales bacterium]